MKWILKEKPLCKCENIYQDAVDCVNTVSESIIERGFALLGSSVVENLGDPTADWHFGFMRHFVI